MSLIHKIERIQRMHQMILFHRTGTPEEFAKKLSVSRSQLYKLIRELKQLNAPIVYCKHLRSFRYLYPVSFVCSFEDRSFTNNEKGAMYGGQVLRIAYKRNIASNEF